MRRSVLFAAAAIAGLAFASVALADNTEGMVGNTSFCSGPDGTTKVYLESGGAFTLTLPNGQSITGTAHDDGSQICYTETNPAPPAGTAPVCTPSVNRKVGDTWNVEARGASQACTLQAGRQ